MFCTSMWPQIQDLNTFLGENSLPDPEQGVEYLLCPALMQPGC